MSGNIKYYLHSIADVVPLEIISAQTFSQIDRMASRFSDFAASEYIMETSLNTELAEVDFSFRILTQEKAALISGLNNDAFSTLAAGQTWGKFVDFINFWPGKIADIWLEMDYAEYEKSIPQPCFFFNARQVKNGTDVDKQLLFSALKWLLDIEQLQSFWPHLQWVIQQLPPAVGLFQAGVMFARNRDRVRIFTGELTREQTREYLSNIGWTSLSRLEELFELINPYSEGQYILDFDISADGISEKIGINFGLKTNDILPDFLNSLVDHHLCTDIKRRGVLAWPGSKGSYLGPDYGYSVLIKDISHFKLSYSPTEGIKVKAYLRVAGVYLKELFKARIPTKEDLGSINPL